MKIELSILDHMSALADGLRGRMLLLLEEHELTVSELGTVLQLPQSTTSRQLKTLADASWVVSRPDGTRRLYRMPVREDGAPDRELWKLTRDSLAPTAAAREDRRRLQPVLAERRERSRAYFDTGAAEWERIRDELFGPRFFLYGLLGLMNPNWIVGDLGCGGGTLSEALAPVVRRVIAVDESEAMLGEARNRLERFDNVELHRSSIETLPLDDRSLDVATLVLVLHHLTDPGKAVREVARVLIPGGRLLIVDMLPHDRQEYRQTMGHVWMGFAVGQIAEMLDQAGFENHRCIELPAETTARGPTLFATSAIRSRSNKLSSTIRINRKKES